MIHLQGLAISKNAVLRLVSGFVMYDTAICDYSLVYVPRLQYYFLPGAH